MEAYDKRLLEKMDKTEQKRKIEENLKDVPDASDKYEEIRITHEPILLLEKIRSKKQSVQQDVIPDEPPDEDE